MNSFILKNANIHTMDLKNPNASAVGIIGNIIFAVGSYDYVINKMPKLENSKIIDMGGRVIIAGITDSHIHTKYSALFLEGIQADLSSIDEVTAEVKKRSSIQKEGSWITGWGWDNNKWGGVIPTKEHLDLVSPYHPVFITSKSGHSAWVNSLALKIAGVDSNTKNPKGGNIVKNQNGIVGVLEDNALYLVHNCIDISVEKICKSISNLIPKFHEYGITSLHDFDDIDTLEAFQILKEQGKLNIRISKMILVQNLNRAINMGLRSGFGDNFLRINGIKSFADGSLGAETAKMIEPYENTNNFGMFVSDKEKMLHNVLKASCNGLLSSIHAIGDMACKTVLDIFEEVRNDEIKEGRTLLRHRLEHGQIMKKDDIKRIGKLGIVSSMQPSHLIGDMDFAEKKVGKRMRYSYAWRSHIDSGGVVAFGSDSPIESFNPFMGMYSAVTRQNLEGFPSGGLYADERISLNESLQAYTMGGAYAGMEEHIKGSITEGKLADLVVLDRDIFNVPAKDLLSVKAYATIIDGKVVFGDLG